VTRIVAFLPYPPSAGLRAELEAELGETPDYVNLAEVGRLRSLETLRSLRRTYKGRRAVVAVEDEASAAAIPILHAVATGAGAKRVDLFQPGRGRRRLRAGELAVGVAGTIAVNAGWAIVSRRLAERKLRQLAAAPRRQLQRTDERRVLYLNSNLWFGLKAGGSVAHVAGVVNGFLEEGYAVDFFGPGEAPLLEPAVHVHRLSAPEPLALRQEANVQRFQHDAVGEVTRNGTPPYSFLYQRNSIGSYAGVVASRRLRTPLVLEYNGSEVWTAKRWGRGLRYEELALLAEEASLRHATLVVTVSDVSRDELLERGVEPERVVAYPNGVDPDRYTPSLLTDAERTELRARHGIAPDTLVAGFIGTFGQWHGVDVLARAIVALADDEPGLFEHHGLHFLLVGDGLRMGEVRDTLRGSGAEQHVTLTGLVPQSDGARYLAASDLLLSPHVPNPDGSRFFGSPTKLFEYMATGRAIVASELEQIGDVLRPGLHVRELPSAPPAAGAPELAVLTSPGDAAELAAAIRWTADQPEWRERLGANARAHVLERYTWRHHVEAVLARLSELGV
jgi:glycosyltransferase involved in cell wall biosynthesis